MRHHELSISGRRRDPRAYALDSRECASLGREQNGAADIWRKPTRCEEGNR